jgi:hypothetical protein
MKKQPKTKRTTKAKKTNPVDTYDSEFTDVHAWPPPGIDPEDKQALREALPWNQPSGMTSQPLQLLEDDEEDDGLTPEQRREEWLRTASPDTIDWLAHYELQSKCIEYERDHFITNCYAHSISRAHPRDTSAGTYVGVSEGFHNKVARACEKGDTPDNHAIEMLLSSQPWRKAIAVAPDRQQPVDTFGPMHLPESRDPVSSLEADPGPEQRPTHWAPGTPPPDIIAGAMHDFGNYLSALVARQVVAIGFTPDTEAIANARSLARTIKDFQKIYQVEQNRRTAAKPRKTSTGRPRSRAVLDPEKFITIRLEMAEKNKKFKNRKYADLTHEKSVQEAQLSPPNPVNAETSATLEKPVAEAQ